MTQGEAKVFETELVLLTVKTENENTAKVNETETLEIRKRTFKIDVNKRFARLRRNMRKRSASIF